MGGPHVTEVPDEALGRDGGPRHADALSLGEADETWPRIVADAALGQLKEVYTPVDAFGQERKALPGKKYRLECMDSSPACTVERFRRPKGGRKFLSAAGNAEVQVPPA